MTATPTPEPKKLSDEELKKYGIHMATRLQSEDIKGQSNWADIDDDDDDWAPEAITWTDGTKITLPSADESHSQSTDPTPAAAASKIASEKSRSPVPSRTASPSVKSSNLASGKGLILKSGSTEKPSLVAKPPAPAGPSKSPWATLPPVQKTSPVSVEQPAQPAGPRQSAREHGGARPSAYSGPREISADDFSRSAWRDGPGSHKEPYNSQTGRAEATVDRRWSRGDMPTRPSLLQRHHPHHHDPAEPSPPFQSSRPVQDAPYGRRRGSSSVSGASGYQQRTGKAYETGTMAPPDVPNARRGSLNASTDSHISSRNFSPSDQHGGRLQSGHGWHPRPSPTATHAAPHYSQASPDTKQAAQPAVPADAGLQSEEQTVEYQKRLMREKREEAIKRRLEEEAREEAAKAERIRLKLEALGPPPERKSAKKEASSSQGVSSSVTTSSQPAATTSTPAAGSTEIATDREQPSRLAESAHSQPGRKQEEHGNNAVAKLDQPPGQLNPWDKSAPPSSGFASWPSSSQASRNVWGSPNNDRGLGNGTFDPDLGRVPEARTTPLPQPQMKGPAPIAPPNSSRLLTRNQPPEHSYPAPRGDRYAPPEDRPYNEKQNQWVSTVLQSDRSLRDQRAKERQNLDQHLAEQGLNLEQAQPTIKHTWRHESAASRMEGSTSRTTGTPWESTLEDRSKQNIPTSHDGLPPDGVIGAGSSPLLTSGASASSQSRPSRFFPSKDKDTRSEAHANTGSWRSQAPSPPPPTMDDHPVYDGDAARPNVSLPRPHPVVRLPPARSLASGPGRGQRPESTWSSAGPGSYKHNPLPPMSNTHAAQHPTSTTHTAPQSQQEWQEKIYELTGRRAAPKSPVVESASRNALDHTASQQSVTVSLPSHDMARDSTDATSKPMAEECFEEQEMGSLPTVLLPRVQRDDSRLVNLRVKPLQRSFAIQATTARYLDIPDHSGPGIRISFPCMPAPKNVPYHRNTGRANTRGSGRSGGRHRGSGGGYRSGGNGGKKDASPYSAETSANQPSASSTSRGRGSYRGRSGEPWSRRSSQTATN